MKAVLFIAFLALGPVLAEHTPVLWPSDSTSASADVEAATGPISRATTPDADRLAWLCRGRT
jgi:hypothetical protein